MNPIANLLMTGLCTGLSTSLRQTQQKARRAPVTSVLIAIGCAGASYATLSPCLRESVASLITPETRIAKLVRIVKVLKDLPLAKRDQIIDFIGDYNPTSTLYIREPMEAWKELPLAERDLIIAFIGDDNPDNPTPILDIKIPLEALKDLHPAESDQIIAFVENLSPASGLLHNPL